MSIPIELNSLEQCLAYLKEKDKTDFSYLDMAINKKPLSCFPEDNKKYAYFYSDTGLNKLMENIGSGDGGTIHNCGVVRWKV